MKPVVALVLLLHVSYYLGMGDYTTETGSMAEQGPGSAFPHHEGFGFASESVGAPWRTVTSLRVLAHRDAP